MNLMFKFTTPIQDNISFTTGFYVALANVAKLLGKISIGPTVVSDLSL